MFATLFRNGGAGMYPVLGLGLVALFTAAYFAFRGDVRTRGFLKHIDRALIWAIIVATTTNFMTVFLYLAGPAVPAEQVTRILLEGSYESLSPVAMGGAFLMLVHMLLAAGERRASARVPAT